MNKRQVMKAHRTIDLQRPVVEGRRCYQVVCLCGKRSVIGGRAQAENDQKAHRREAWEDHEAHALLG